MSSFDFSIYDYEETPSPSLPAKKTEARASKNDQPFDFSMYDVEFTPSENKKDSFWKSLGRTAYQIPSGIAQAFTYPLDLVNMAALGAALDPSEMHDLEMTAQKYGIPFDPEKYTEAAKSIASNFPTQSNIERMVEEKTGLPLEAKTGLQKAVKLGSAAGTINPGTLGQKAASGVATPVIKEGLEITGVPEPLAELASLPLGAKAGASVPEKLAAKTKPSGMTLRRFENVEKPTEISASKHAKLNEKIEQEFRTISDDIVKTSPIQETKIAIKENPEFKSQVAEKFKQVEDLAQEITEPLNTETIKNTLTSAAEKKKAGGLAPSEYEKEFEKYLNSFAKEIPEGEVNAVDLVTQYRKNNKALSEAYDPSRTYAFNRAKKDALIEYNRSLANLIEQQYPNSSFSNLFKETNKQWSNIADAEAIDGFIDSMFKGKIDYKKGKKLFESENTARPFKRALGDEGFNKFKQLVKDTLDSEQSMKMLKVAKEKGYRDLLETAGLYVLHPNAGIVKGTYDLAKQSYKGLVNAMIDKPQLEVVWRRANKELKTGNFEAAQRDFKYINTVVNDMNNAHKSDTQERNSEE